MQADKVGFRNVERVQVSLPAPHILVGCDMQGALAAFSRWSECGVQRLDRLGDIILYGKEGCPARF
ncbi:hypothetical protein GCM10011503_03210 [Henriciella pelagia]|uniref:Uncharacterized protein n=1 Tax=Henriciella pelagia TaxID=1977912 RepID=A0ABQ1J3V4_9PROT|nr:hypothetical protein GCM10011503_03210 [Henriciella pelagia]